MSIGGKFGVAVFMVLVMTSPQHPFESLIRATIIVAACWFFYEYGKHNGKEETERK